MSGLFFFALAVGAAEPATSTSADQIAGDTLVSDFAKYCLAGDQSVYDTVSAIGQNPEWNSISPPISGRLHKSDRNYAWERTVGGITFLLRLSSKTKDKSFSTICNLQGPPVLQAQALEAAFFAAANRVGLRRGDYLAPVFFQYSGRLTSGKRAHATLSSAPVRRGFANLSANTLKLSVIY